MKKKIFAWLIVVVALGACGFSPDRHDLGAPDQSFEFHLSKPDGWQKITYQMRNFSQDRNLKFREKFVGLRRENKKIAFSYGMGVDISVFAPFEPGIYSVNIRSTNKHSENTDKYMHELGGDLRRRLSSIEGGAIVEASR